MLTPAEIDRITRYLHIESGTPVQADLAFVFGTRYSDPLNIVRHLYQQRIVPHIVLTGGINRHTGINEALTHYDILTAAGIPDDAIIIEAESTNTYENAVFARPKISERIPLEKLRSIIVIAKWFHARRATMTLKAQMPTGIRYYMQTYAPENTAPENWHVEEENRQRVLKNWRGIPVYLKRGHIVEIRQIDDYWV